MNNLSKLVLTASMVLAGLIISPKKIDCSFDYFLKDKQIVQEKEYPLNDKGFPTTEGIEQYVKDNEYTVIEEFERFFNVSINSMGFETDNLEGYLNVYPDEIRGGELGLYFEDYAVISNSEDYLGYSLKTTDSKKLANIPDTYAFVKATMIHEIGHDYIEQVIAELLAQGIHASPEYTDYRRTTDGSRFNKEGIAQYCVRAMNESKMGSNHIPKSYEKLTADYYTFYYKYSELFLRNFLKEKGLREGIRTLVVNAPAGPAQMMNFDEWLDNLKNVWDIEKHSLLYQQP